MPGAVGASYIVAHSETNRIVQEQNILRSIDVDNGIHNNLLNNNVSIEIAKGLDNLKYIAAFSAQTTNELHNAIQLRHRVTHMYSEETVLSFNDPGTERWLSI